MGDAIVARLREVGFSLYEARLYLALLEGGSQNGNEVAKHAAVPSSKVYAALDKLAASGFVVTSRRGSSTRYAAIPPDELISRLRKHYNEPLDFLDDELPKVQSRDPSEPFLTVSGVDATREAATALIEHAEVELHISCWPEDLEVLSAALGRADSRGVRIFGMLYGDAVEPGPGSWLRHHYDAIVGSRVEGRFLALVVDEVEALIARIPDEGIANAVRSRNPVMTLVVREYLHHDSVLQRAQLSIGFHDWDQWWEADPDARSEILGQVFPAGRPKRKRTAPAKTRRSKA